METKKINCNLSLKITIKRTKEYLEQLPLVYVFKKDSVHVGWTTSTDVTLKYVLKLRDEIEYIEISILKQKKGTQIFIQGEKNLSLEYFRMELEKIL